MSAWLIRLAVAVLLLAPLRAQALAELAADINLGAGARTNGDPREFARLGDIGYFRACDRAHGCELWRSDGTSAGTMLLADLCPGPCSSYPQSLRVAFGSTLYFSADDGTHGFEPWQYRPDLGAPRLVADLNPGAGGSSPANFVSITSPSLSGVFFTAAPEGDTFANAIVRATESGGGVFTSLAVAPGPLRSIGLLTPLGEKLFFRASDAAGIAGSELYTLGADGPGAFAFQRLRDIRPGPSGASIDSLTPVPALGLMFFRADDSGGNLELWRSDGTPAGTVLVKDIRATGSSQAQSLTAFGNRLYFSADDAAQGSSNRELWSSDGSTAGTNKLLEIAPGGLSANPSALRVLGNQLVFVANDGTSGNEFYRSDGTAAGTVRIVDLQPGSAGLDTVTASAVVEGYYYAGTSTRLFRTDGTAAGSRQVGPTFADVIFGVSEMTAIGGGVLFSLTTFAEGEELYGSRVDNPAQAGLLRVIGDQVGHSDARFLHELAEGRVLMAYDESEGFEWRRLEPGGGASLLGEPSPGSNTAPTFSDWQVRSTSGPARLWFIRSFSELWITDGSDAGTRFVFDFDALPQQLDITCSAPRGSELVLLVERSSTSGRELWLSDGTAEGTRALLMPENMPNGITLDLRFCPFAVGDTILVSARTPGTGSEVFRSNGSVGNLSLLRDFTPGQESTLLDRSTVVGGLGFLAIGNATASDFELWRTDGTAQGTFQLGPINPGGNAAPRSITAFGAGVAFSANDGLSGRELYCSDGTVAGTRRVVDLYSGPGSAIAVSDSARGSEIVVDAFGRIFFAAIVEGRGRELYVSDGTEAGTRRIDPPGASGPIQPQDLVALEAGGVLFSGYTPASGRELWFSDGSDEGTFLLSDIAPGAASGGPRQLTATRDGAFFTAIDGAHGDEPWQVRISLAPAVFADGFE